ncbi:MAG: apolipoprotein N-acyltransferase [Bacteroidetes bacterium]|nr:apolipoprotein N-acyltransferase [Bacteroidota bacterium]
MLDKTSTYFKSNPIKSALITGALMGTTWLYSGLWPFALVCPGVMLWCLVEQDNRTRFLISVAFFTSSWSVAFYWNALHPNKITALSSIVALFCMICIQAGLITFFSSPRRGIPSKYAPLFGMLGVAIWDWLSLHGPIAMPGTMLGLSVSDSMLAKLWAPLTGSFGLTLLVLGFNAAWVAWLGARKNRWWIGLLLPSLLFLPQFLAFSKTTSTKSLSVAVVQPGMTPSAWADVTNPAKSDHLFLALDSAKTLYPAAQFIVLPETSLPIAPGDSLKQTVKGWSERLQSSILTGAIAVDTDGNYFNAAVFADTSGQALTYSKQKLVPFVESVPLADLLPFGEYFRLESGGVTAYSAGRAPGIVNIDSVNAGLLICFESFFPSDAFYLRSLGAEFLVILTQDGWWQSQTARKQHAAYSRLLAYSVGIPVVQSSVDGVTAVWDASGVLLASSSSNEREIVFAKIPIEQIDTFYSKWGDFTAGALLASLLLLYLALSILFPYVLKRWYA